MSTLTAADLNEANAARLLKKKAQYKETFTKGKDDRRWTSRNPLIGACQRGDERYVRNLLLDRKEDLKHERQFWVATERIRNDFLVEGGVWYAGKVMENGGEAVDILPFRLYSDLISRLSFSSL